MCDYTTSPFACQAASVPPAVHLPPPPCGVEKANFLNLSLTSDLLPPTGGGTERERSIPRTVGASGLQVRLEAQGGLFEVRVSGFEARGGGRRAPIVSFSFSSRRNLLKKLARLDPRRVAGASVFISLTYPDPVPTPAEVKRDLAVFWKRLVRFAVAAGVDGLSAVWRFEWDSSGERNYNPHLHLIVFGLPFLPKDQLKQMWAEVIGRDDPWTRIELIKSWRGVLSYVSKYIAKVTPSPYESFVVDPDTGEVTAGGVAVDGVGSSTLANLAGLPSGFPDPWRPGRLWGFLGREFLPWADLVAEVYTLARASWKWFYDLRRAVRKVFAGISRRRAARGFFLFTEYPSRWLELAAFYSASG